MGNQDVSWAAGCCAIALDQAWYCESCRVITNAATCCSCASAEHCTRLAPWLDHEREPISIPPTGVYLTVIPAARKGPKEAERPQPSHRLRRVS